MAVVTDNDHWSIGEVLSLLQDEFPEITISKIRFLESQGLISPERTPSGYRRFYQVDFDRLHWILVQQRDHYLPLKVIRDRLDSGESGLTESTESAGTLLRGSDTLFDAASGSEDADSLHDGTIAEGADGDATSEHPIADSGSPAGQSDEALAQAPPAEAQAETAAEPAEDAEPSPTVDEIMQSAAPGTDPALAAKVDAAVAASAPVTERRESTDGGPDDIDHDIALTKEELADASGCGMPMIHDLERFGLIAGRETGPAILYDGEALMIARLAGQFGSYGLDPRHLRTFLVGASREVELLFQVVEPLLYRRDPEQRKRSLDTLDDLVELSANLRAILMRQRVRAQLPSQRG